MYQASGHDESAMFWRLYTAQANQAHTAAADFQTDNIRSDKFPLRFYYFYYFMLKRRIIEQMNNVIRNKNQERCVLFSHRPRLYHRLTYFASKLFKASCTI